MAFDRDGFIKKVVKYLTGKGKEEKQPYSAVSRGQQILKKKKEKQGIVDDLFKDQ